MPIETELRKIRKKELPSIVDEMLASSMESSEKHMDFSHASGVLFVSGKEKRIPFYKFKNLEERKALKEDFFEFLRDFGVDSESDGNKFSMATIFLGMSSGRSRSFYVSDYKQVVSIARSFALEHGVVMLVVSHFSEKTGSNGIEVEHAHILYEDKVASKQLPSICDYIEERYENS